MSEVAISVNNVSKMYKLYDNPMDRLKESLGLSRKKKYKEHYALNDVSFQVHKGDTVGIIGTNGFWKIYDFKDYHRSIESHAGTSSSGWQDFSAAGIRGPVLTESIQELRMFI